jgi:hypothetical protein
MYGIFLAIVAAIAFGCIVLANELDKAPKNHPDKARWAQTDAPNIPPKPTTSRSTATPAPTPTSRAT